ncbi:MAG: GNVR domain-containing protein, partial [Thermodesulfobacteriota bacterium]|nr:GNVR domain-containing protein [Thermodesulfobacteriota bacterium]
LKVKMGSIRNIRLLNPPEPSVGAIKPRKSLNIILAFVIGLIVSFFLAFFLEYIQKMRVNA